MTRRAKAGGLAALALLLLAAVLIGPPPNPGARYDPESTGPQGVRALVELLEALQVRVEVGADPLAGDPDVVLVLRDRMDEAHRSELRDWVEAGGTVVVADPSSSLHGLRSAGGVVSDVLGPVTRSRDCDLPVVEGVESLAAAEWRFLEVPDGARGCFNEGTDAAWMVVVAHGAGEIVALGQADIWTNRYIDLEGNALLAANLLAPSAQDLRFVVPPPPGTGDATLLDLVPDRIWAALVVVGLAFGVVAAARARRLGPPIEEDLPIRVPGSELTYATAELLQRGGHVSEAAALLQDGLRRDAARALGLPRGASLGTVRQRVVTVLGDGVPGQEALNDVAVATEEDLIRLARDVTLLRARLVRGQLR